MTARISAVGGNVTDLTTRLSDGLYVLVAEVDIPVAADIDALRERLDDVARDLGVEVSLRAVATDDL